MTTKKKPTKASGAAALDAVAVDGAVDVPLKDEVTLGIVEGSKASTARKDTYAFLHSRSRTSEARQLISEVYDSITEWEAQTGARSYKRRARSANTFVNALERVVGDLLRAKADPSRSGRLFRPIGRDRFKYDPIKHDVFKRVVDDLKGLELVGHALGKPRYFKIPEEWGGGSIARTGEGKASRFWATPKLLALAEHHGIHRDNVRAHFRPEPPLHPLVLTGPSRGRGRHKERGEIIKNFPRTPQTEKLEADVRELNAFLDQCEIAGGGHEGYTRRFNLGTTTFDKGGRLSSRGEECYQLKKPAERLKMSINGEAVAEVDVSACHLTIYHAKIAKQPLKDDADPYASTDVPRDVAKLWVLVTFGNSEPATNWPTKIATRYKKDTGVDLNEVAKASDVGQRMLAAFPALRRLKDHVWAELQYLEAEAIIGTMLALKRDHGVRNFRLPRRRAVAVGRLGTWR